MRGANPDFAITDVQARREAFRMRRQPTGLRRPVVVLDGYHQPAPLSAGLIASRLAGLTGADRRHVLAISYPLAFRLNGLAEHVVRRVLARWPSDTPDRTVEVDVVAFSMGGLIAREAAMDGPGRPRLNIVRLFTIATPHRGARVTTWLAPDAAARAMRPGSPYLARLDAALGDAKYELICYARLNDLVVGACQAAPPGMVPLWLPGPLVRSHVGARHDLRILVDIARRLRGEAPLARPGAPPPHN